VPSSFEAIKDTSRLLTGIPRGTSARARSAGDSQLSQLLLQFGNPIKQVALFFDELEWYIGGEHKLCLTSLYESQISARLGELVLNRAPVLFGDNGHCFPL
jgi:hypothetical protein